MEEVEKTDKISSITAGSCLVFASALMLIFSKYANLIWMFGILTSSFCIIGIVRIIQVYSQWQCQLKTAWNAAEFVMLCFGGGFLVLFGKIAPEMPNIDFWGYSAFFLLGSAILGSFFGVGRNAFIDLKTFVRNTYIPTGIIFFIWLLAGFLIYLI